MGENIVQEKPAGVSNRLKALLFDWLFICLYLFLLFVVMMIIYLVILGGIPELSQLQSQLISAFTTILPIIIIFSAMEGRGAYASWGKKKKRLIVSHNYRPLKGSMIRNTLKFLPWQLGHMSTIYGIYNGYDSLFPLICLVLSLSLVGIYIGMMCLRKDRRHLADLIARTQIVQQLS